MNIISLKDYARKCNISYEAVRQQVTRYRDELGAHIIRDGRQQFLDEEAVAFLDGKRQKNPVAIIQQDKDEAIEQLRNEKEQLLVKLAAIQEWRADNALAIAAAEQTRLALTAAQAQLQELEGAHQKELASVQGELAQEKADRAAEAARAAQELAESQQRETAALAAREAAEAALAAYKALPWYRKVFSKKGE